MEGITYLLLVAVLANVVLGIAVLSHARRERISRIVFALCICIAAWGVFTISYLAIASLLFARLSFATGILVVAALFYFVLEYPTAWPVSRHIIPLVRWSTLLWVGLSMTPLVLRGFPVVAFGFLIYSYVAYFVVLLLSSMYLLVQRYRRARGSEQYRVLYVLVAAFAGILWGTIFNLVIPVVLQDIPYNQWGAFGPSISIAGMAYVVLKNRLFNLQLQTQRLINSLVPIAAAVGLALLGQVLVAYAGVPTGPSVSTGLTLGALGCYAAFRRLFTQTQAGSVLFRRTYRWHTELLTLASTIGEYGDLDELAMKLKNAVSSHHATTDVGLLIVTEQSQRAWIPHEVTTLTIARLGVFTDAALHAELFDLLVATKQALVVDELPYRKQCGSSALRAALKELAGGVCVPLLVGPDLTGVLVLGVRPNHAAYTSEDVAVLNQVSIPIAVALTKAKLLADYRYKNDRLARDKRNLLVANEELRRMKREFLTIANHQLNTPLSVMQASLAMMKDGDVAPDEMRGFVASIEPKMQEFQRIVNDMLDVADWEGLSAELQFAPTSPVDALTAVIRELEPLFRNVQFITTLAKDLPRVMTDPGKLRAALRSLLDNACRFGKGDKIEIVAQLSDIRRVQIRVLDHGRGFSTAEAEHIGELFYRGTGVFEYHANGSGLGVYLAKRIAEASGGALTWASAGPGHGAEFTLELPRATDFIQQAGLRDPMYQSAS